MSQLHHNWGAGSALYVWLVAQHHVQLYYVNSCFSSALRAEQRESYKDGICVNLCPGSVLANGAWNPIGSTIILYHSFSFFICTFKGSGHY